MPRASAPDRVKNSRKVGSCTCKATVSRARRIQRFLSQPFHVAENFTGVKGAYVKMEDTIRGFQAILGGECDDLPEQAFLMCGTIDEVLAKRDQFR